MTLSAEAKARKKETSRLRYQRDRERILAQQREYKRANPQIVAAQERRRYEKHGERLRTEARARHRTGDNAERMRRYRAENPDYFRAKCAERRALQAGSEADFTETDWHGLLEEFDHCCAYCQARGIPLEREHMRALVMGGRHTKANIVPACRECNARKGRRSIFGLLSIV